MKTIKKPHILVRWFHFAFAMSIVLSLGFSLVMISKSPIPGQFPLEVVAFNLHKILGLNALVLLLTYMFWHWYKNDRSRRDLMPLLSLMRLRQTLSDLKTFDMYRSDIIAAMFVNLGWLLAVLVTASGTALIIGMIYPDFLSQHTESISWFHEQTTYFLWAYLLFHVGAAIAHLFNGQPYVAWIFDLFDRYRPPTEDNSGYNSRSIRLNPESTSIAGLLEPHAELDISDTLEQLAAHGKVADRLLMSMQNPATITAHQPVSAVLAQQLLINNAKSRNGDFLQQVLKNGYSDLPHDVIEHIFNDWKEEFTKWQKHDLSNQVYRYIWADGLYITPSLNKSPVCVLVLLGETLSGHHEFISLRYGARGTQESWSEVLQDASNRGLKAGMSLFIGDANLGLWPVLAKKYPTARVQFCWRHLFTYLSNKLKLSSKNNIRKLFSFILSADTDTEEMTYKNFEAVIQTISQYPNSKDVTDTLIREKPSLFRYLSYPSTQHDKIRTTRLIDSVFSRISNLDGHALKQPKITDKKKNSAMSIILPAMYILTQSAERAWSESRLH